MQWSKEREQKKAKNGRQNTIKNKRLCTRTSLKTGVD